MQHEFKGFFEASNARIMDAEEAEEHNLDYRLRNVILEDGYERLIIPASMVSGVDPLNIETYKQAYEFTLLAPAGDPPEAVLEALRDYKQDRLKEGTIDPTMLELCSPVTNALFFVNHGHRPGKRTSGTFFHISRIDVPDRNGAQRCYEEQRDLAYRLASVNATRQHLYKHPFFSSTP